MPADAKLGAALPWAPSVYYAASALNCTAEAAWPLLLDYETWNPTFVGAEVSRVRGVPCTEGELVLIKKSLSDADGAPLDEFYAETVKVVPQRHIVWYVFPKEGDAFRNFVEFGLDEDTSGVRFTIAYFQQTRLTGESLASDRRHFAALLDCTAQAFRRFCEARA